MQVGPRRRSERGRRLMESAAVDGGVARAAALLVAGSFVNAAVGLLFWLVAARRLDRAELGADAALLALATAAAGLGVLDLPNVLPRYLPGAGARARRIAAAAQLAAIGLAVVVGSVLVLVATGSSAAASDALPRTVWQLVGVALAIGVWTSFSLQDALLIAVGRERLLLVANLVFAVAKLGALAVLAGRLGAAPVVISWMVPAALVALVVQVAVVRPGVSRLTSGPDLAPPGRRLAFVVVSGSAANVVGTVVVGLLPLVVAARLGTSATAGYQLVWSAVTVLFLAPRSVAQAALARVGADPDRLESVIAAALRGALVLVGAAAVLVAVAAGPVLGLVGSSYRADSTSLLRLMALAAVPHCVLVLAGAWARGRQLSALVIGLNAVEYLTVLALAVALSDPLGLTGLGWAWLLGETAVAGLVLVAHGAARRRVDRRGGYALEDRLPGRASRSSSGATSL